MKNKILLIIAVSMFPIAVISFTWNKEVKTNFNLPQNNTTVKVLIDGTVKSLDLEEYIIGVVAGEMPASFEIETLKAQAVASRSYALYKKANSNGIYDLTDDINSQVYIDEIDMRKKWGEDYEKYYYRIKSAVEDTAGQVATYNDQIIEALYFSMSSGQTQDVEMVFGESIDYLKSVESKYDNEQLKNFSVKKTFSYSEFYRLLDLNCENLIIDYINKNTSNYVDEISVCGKKFSGTKFRTLLSLRSANFEILVTDIVEITTFGYGHGVGMSQYGANGYAKNGYTYDEILKHYYKDIKIENIKSV